jgi:cell division protein FtsN
MTMPRPLPLLLALALGVGAALLVACGTGTEDGIPAADASELKSQLEDVRQAVDAGRCDDVPGQVRQVVAGVDRLPSSVDARLRDELRNGAERLRNRAIEECNAGLAEPTTTETQPSTQTQTQTTPTVTTTVPTTTTPTTTQPPADTVTTPPTTQAPAPPEPVEPAPGGGTPPEIQP